MYRLMVPTLVVLAAATSGAALAGGGSMPDDVQAVRAEVARYHSVEQAQRVGYVFDEHEPCVTAPPAPVPPTGPGTMGIHALNPALLDDPAIDPLRPELLLYVPKEKGKLQLVGVEYMRRAADQTPPIDESDRPSLFGQAFQGPMPEHAPGMGWHYDLHVWLFAEHPNGLFAMFNSALSC
jgi:hypothetical protein